MLGTLGRAVYRWRWQVLAAGLAALVAATGYGSGVFADLGGSGFADPGSESARAERVADEHFPRAGADVVVLYTSGEHTADDPAYRHAVDEVFARLPRGSVVSVETPWSTGSPRLVSNDRRSVAVLVRLTGADQAARRNAYEAVRGPLSQPPAGLRVALGGSVPVSADLNAQVESDIRRAELVSLPALLLLLVLLIGGVVAAGVPLVIGALVITGSFAVLRALTGVTDVSVFSVNVVSMLGLGLAVDYALLVITRFREELRARETVAEAVTRTVATAGRTVAVSGLIIAGTLAPLLLFPQVYFRSVGLAGIAVTALAVLAATTLLPALLAVLGRRVNALRVPFGASGRAGRHRADSAGGWFRFATAVMRRPVALLLIAVPLLVFLGTPFLRVNFGDIDYRALPESTQSRVVAERLTVDFPGGGPEPVDVVVTFTSGGSPPATALNEYRERLRALPGVASVTVTGDAAGATRLSVAHAYDRQSKRVRTLVSDIRLTTAPPGARVLVGGDAAELVDLLASLRGTLPWVAVAVFGVTVLVLALAFRSLVLPVKAVLMSVLSLSASFGAVVWVFQDGHLSGLLGFTPTGAVEATQPVLMFAIAFGLSTDYEVFLLSRIREEWARTGDHARAVATGVQRTAPIITSAAILLVVVIGAFSLSGISFLKMIGVGLAITILVDATVVRAVLVPATMRLLGPACWWAPAPLIRVARRFGGGRQSRPVRRTAPPRIPTAHPTPTADGRTVVESLTPSRIPTAHPTPTADGRTVVESLTP